MTYLFYYDLAPYRLGIAENGSAITQIFFASDTVDPAWADASVSILETPLLKQAASELQEYFSGTRKVFSLPLSPEGTPFQRSVWQALQKIPYGETRTYGQVAQSIGNPRACRAVGNANHNNPISILIPCHRVIGANGKYVGYAGGLAVKEYLLCLEQNRKV